MPRLTIAGAEGDVERTTDVEAGQRLVLAIEAHGVHIGHRCGGFAKCTTCRVEFLAGEPDTMTAAEHAVLTQRGLIGQYRLSCQILCAQDMHVRPGMTVESQGWDGPGPTPQPEVTPEAKWYPKAELERDAPAGGAGASGPSGPS